MKKIVLLTGSARKNGNSFAMAKAFEEAARECGHTVVRFDTAFIEISGCTACNACCTNGGLCAADDAFNAIAAELESADAIVFASPVYWYTFPAKLKAVIDKFYALYNGKRLFNGKRTALIACCEDSTLEAFNGLVFAYAESMKLMGAELAGEVLIPGVHKIGDIAKTDGERRAGELARTLLV